MAIGTGTAILGGALLGGGLSFLGASKSAGAIESAASEAAGVQKYIFDQQMARLDPFYQAGVGALPYLQAYTGVPGMPINSLRAAETPSTTADRGGQTITYAQNPVTGRYEPASLEDLYIMNQYNDHVRTEDNPETYSEFRQHLLNKWKISGYPPELQAQIDQQGATGEGRIDPRTGEGTVARPMNLRDIERTGVTRSPESLTDRTGWTRPTSGTAPETVPIPSYEDTVFGPMADWQYEESPAFQAKIALARENLNNQLQARALAPSAVGANRDVDLVRRMTAEDYDAERLYQLGQYTDLYRGRLSENTLRYNRLLDLVKGGMGATSSMGAAGNQYATGVGEASMAAGQAKAGFYSGLAGLPIQLASTGLRAYDMGQQYGWWNSPTSQPATQYPTGSSDLLGGALYT